MEKRIQGSEHRSILLCAVGMILVGADQLTGIGSFEYMGVGILGFIGFGVFILGIILHMKAQSKR